MASRSNTDHFRIMPSRSAASPAPALSDLTQMNITNELHDHPNPAEPTNVAFVKGAKRKRLSKACDACHKSKRRCDGTAPCSNCYFASKECTYTDSSGRPVPAPRNVHPQLGVDHLAVDAAQSGSVYRREGHQATPRPHPSAESSLAGGLRRIPELPNDLATKRVRPEGVDTSASIIIPLSSPSVSGSATGSPSSLLDPTTTHELTNLFFTHNNPGRMIIHKPSFSAALTHEQVPSYLVLALCSNSATHSKDLATKAPTPRLAGVPFFQEAVSIMFDASGRLLAEPNLATAQALCLLELHEVSASHSWTKHYRYFDLALKILEESLDVTRADDPLWTTTPLSPSARTTCIERECTRRCFWLIQIMSWINGIYTFRPLRPRSIDLMRHVRLPADETSFELAVPVHSPGEFMHIPAPRSKYASHFGHLCRILSLYQRLQVELNSSKESSEMMRAVNDVKKSVQIWTESLADHLRFSKANLERQVSMFETSSNTGAWAFCFMHVLHPCLILSMTEVDRREAEVVGWVRNQLNTVFTAIGGRAKNTILSACALWVSGFLRIDWSSNKELIGVLIDFSQTYSKYQPHDPQLHKWDDEFERLWGFRVAAVADQWRKCQEEQRSQIGRTYPVETLATKRESPPAFAVTGSSPSSAGSSPHELEPQHHAVDRAIVVVDVSNPGTESGPGRHGYIQHPHGSGSPHDTETPPSSANSTKDSRSLPSLKASGLLDSWNPSSKPHHQQQSRPSPPHQHQQRAMKPPQTAHPHSHPLVAHPPHTVPSQGRSGQSMPVGLNWLNSES
ncbi:hypothetical protein BXZ70DRAFT_384818 [Cristinia sonorae]|uniref:Zn(2)-C6 fungal-type domain-containing protein n=1 Tax=Cristinia sonorae TaxID=1940300 RepID=A0A8K0UK10_9AGAR|nr:hypothetical protein BXZ70DRAFT_384818 [Cristinia sonorae]